MERQVTVILKDEMYFEADTGDGFILPLDSASSSGGQEKGVRPFKLLLAGLGGCTGMDVISILRKKRQEVSGLEVRVTAEQRVDEHPHVYLWAKVTYIITGKNIDPQAVERAIELSETRYCPAMATLRQAFPIESTYEIVEVP